MEFLSDEFPDMGFGCMNAVDPAVAVVIVRDEDLTLVFDIRVRLGTQSDGAGHQVHLHGLVTTTEDFCTHVVGDVGTYHQHG